MRYREDFDRSRLISDAALEIMADRRIPVNPANFAVWYAYASGAAPKLKTSLEVLLTNKVDFTAERNNQIYEEFFSSEGEADAVDTVGSKVQQCAEGILQDLGRARTGQGEFGDRVGFLAGTLSGANVLADISHVVRDILVETQSITVQSREFEQKLSSSTEEIKSLRADLQVIRMEALTDSLTGIANRKCFDQTLHQTATEAMGTGTALSLLLLDIDHFKKFNDTYGHPVGDSVLRVVAAQLRQSVKGRDLPARYGGEEFAILLPKTTMRDAAKLAAQIKTEVAARQLKDSRSDRTYGTITLSIGVAEFRFGESLEDFVARADEALYAAKESGRNRVALESKAETTLSAAG